MSNDSPKIFIADDDDLDTQMTQRAINRVLPRAEIVTVEDGETALSELDEMLQTEPPDLILMDFRMPKMGCLEILRSLNNRDIVRSVPFILFSSSVGPTDVENCIREGATAYVEKPTDPEAYSQVIAQICRKYATLI